MRLKWSAVLSCSSLGFTGCSLMSPASRFSAVEPSERLQSRLLRNDLDLEGASTSHRYQSTFSREAIADWNLLRRNKTLQMS